MPAVTTAPADLSITALGGEPRTLREWVTTFHLVVVAIDPYTDQSAWILDTADRILTNFREADCRVAWLVTVRRRRRPHLPRSATPTAGSR